MDSDFSESTVRRVLRDADLQPHRQKMWLTSQDEEFRAKRDDVLHVYYDAPQDEHIICVDEMTGVQILERLCPDIPMASGAPVRREFEYKRHGTLTLMGALDVRRGKVFGFVSEGHDGLTFVELLDVAATCHVEFAQPGAGRGRLAGMKPKAGAPVIRPDSVRGSSCCGGSAARHGHRATARRRTTEVPREPSVGDVDGVD